MANTETFKISAALKDLIGKELITDEFVAVFELVKNSFDANASKVEVIFENNYEPDNSRIIIKDNGKGMNYNDLKNKWLFVAYSAKRLGKENEDYRDKIKTQRVFAGAKGVGRFSCDRLGRFLNLTTIKDEPKPKIENLLVNWEDFENADDEEFVNIKVTHKVLTENACKLKKGTVLEITGLRDNWDRDRILKLKKSLAKLINPNQENDSDNFEIEIIAEDEIKRDKEQNKKGEKKNDLEIVNGLVKNSIFETLEIKTSNILVQISPKGEYIETTLQDRGDLIYYLKEKNPYKDLKNVSVYLFQLNRAAKANFTRIMGMEPVKYGSVFMYKNGFRVYPYGEEGEDGLGIERRKQQGYNRFLGTRDLIGRIEMNVPAGLDVDGNLTIMLNAGINANDGSMQISVGKNWTNNNTYYASNLGFDPGGSSIVEFNGTVDQSLTTSSPQEDFAHLIIDKSGGKFRSNDNIQVFGDLTIQNGTWEDWLSGLTHTLNRHFTVSAGGALSNSTNKNTVQFVGGNNSVLTYNGASGYFYNLYVNKSGGASVTQVGNTSCQFTGNFTINNGVYNLNGYDFHASGGLAINSGATFSMPAGSDLAIVGGQTLNVGSGGLLSIAGTAGNLATIRSNVTSSRYNLTVNSGANIAAEYCTFKHMTTNGVNVMSGAWVDPAHAFRGCVFQDGQSLGSLLTINNSQTLTIRNAVFPTNTWAGSYNVAKGLNAGQVYFVNYSGAFAGEDFDNDAFGRVTWVPTLVATPTATPAMICAGSTSQLHANPSGGIAPYTYLWTPSTGLTSTAIENPVATLMGTITYNVLVTDALGTTASNTVTVTVIPYMPVSVSIAASANPSPPGNFVLYTATPVNGGSFPAYQWKVNGANVGTGLSTYSYVPLNGDVVTCVMTSSYMCPTGSPATSNAITMIIVNTNTSVTGNIIAPLNLCFDASNTITVAGGGTTFTVQSGGSATMIAGQKIRYLPTTVVYSGGYMHGYITLTHSYCGSLPPAMVAISTGTSETPAPAEGEHFAIYPNPTSGMFTLYQQNATVPGTVDVEVLTIKGEKVFKTILRDVFKGTFDLRGQPSGMYLVKIRKADDLQVMKLIINK